MNMGNAWNELEKLSNVDLLGSGFERKEADGTLAILDILEHQELADKLGIDGADLVAFSMAPAELFVRRAEELKKLLSVDIEAVERHSMSRCFAVGVMLGAMYEKMRMREFAEVFSAGIADDPTEGK